MSRLLWISSVLLCLPVSAHSQDFSKLSDHADESVRKDVQVWKQLSSFRDWKDASGEHEIRARFERFDLGTASIVLRKKNGDEISIDVLKLGEEERATVRRIAELQTSLSGELLAFLDKRIAELTSELSSARGRMTQLANANAVEMRKLLKEIKRLSMYEPSNKLADDDGIPIVTAKRLELYGSEFVGKQVKMTNCEFNDISTRWVDKLVTIVDRAKLDKWTGFQLNDSTGDFFQFAFASKAQHGEFLLSLKRKSKLNLLGTVIELEGRSDYGVVFTTIEKIK